MKEKDIVEGMEVRLRKNINKCTYTVGYGDEEKDDDLCKYKGKDVVTVLSIPDNYGDVKVEKVDTVFIWVNCKHLRKIG